MDCNEAEFIAENEQISVVPNFTDKKELHLISGDVGPFEAGMAVSVPLWLALYLKERHQCQIVPPSWLTVEKLEELVAAETEEPKFTKVPSRFMEISYLLLHRAPEEIADGDKLKILIKDLWDARQAKLRKDVSSILETKEETYARLDYLTQMEITVSRPFLTGALNTLRKLQTAVETVSGNLPSS